MPAIPFIPDIDPFLLPHLAFERLIEKTGIDLMWLKSHGCPCVYGGPIPGSPDPKCVTCRGRGIYWDQPAGPFRGLITYLQRSASPTQPGTGQDTDQGLYNSSTPSLTIPAATSMAWSGLLPTIWQQASQYDMFVEISATTRFNARLIVGSFNAVPYQQNVVIAASGAVTVYDTDTHMVVPVSGYVVSGAVVTLPGTYETGTAYTVDFIASPAYVAFRDAGGSPHTRPFSNTPQPRRFQLQQLDLWTRARFQGDIPTS